MKYKTITIPPEGSSHAPRPTVHQSIQTEALQMSLEEKLSYKLRMDYVNKYNHIGFGKPMDAWD